MYKSIWIMYMGLQKEQQAKTVVTANFLERAMQKKTKVREIMKLMEVLSCTYIQEMERLKAELDVMCSDRHRMTERLNMGEGTQQPFTASVPQESEVQAVVPSGSPLSTSSTESSSGSSQVLWILYIQSNLHCTCPWDTRVHPY